MSDEIKKAQQMALELKIHEVINNIITKAGTMPNATKAEWEGCKLASFSFGVTMLSITMSNGMVLYKAKIGFDDIEITDFRYGSWVEKLKAYSEKITADKKSGETEQTEQEKQAKLAPFAEISDEEFEKMVRQSQY